MQTTTSHRAYSSTYMGTRFAISNALFNFTYIIKLASALIHYCYVTVNILYFKMLRIRHYSC